VAAALAPAARGAAVTASSAAPSGWGDLLTVSGGGAQLPVVSISSASVLVSFHLGDIP
jgi:hypothetical protein